jgi:hypothetical protein
VANRPSRIVIPVRAVNYDGRYWGDYPNGDKPNTGAVLQADALGRVGAAGQLSTAIRAAAGALDTVNAGGGLSSAIRLLAAATSSDTATASLAGIFDFFISSSGSNSNDGLSTSTPWALSALADATKASAIAGKRVGLLDGTYRLTASNTEACLFLHANASGTSTTRTVIQAVNERAAIITTNNGSGVYPQGANSPAAIQTEASWIDFVGIKFTDMAFAGLAVHASHVRIYSSEFSNIVATRNTTFNDSNCGGIYFRDSSLAKTDVLVNNCLFDTITNYSQGGSSLRDSKSEGVGSLFGITNLTIEFCTFKNLGQPLYNKVNVANVTFRKNIAYNCYIGWLAGPGVESSLRDGTTANYCYGNLFVVNNMWGQGSAWIANVAADNFAVYNNTIVLKPIDGTDDGNNYGYFDFADEAGSTGVFNQSLTFFNNIITAPSGLTGTPATLVRFRAGTQSPQNRCAIWNYNCFFPSSEFQVWDEANAHTYTTLAAWQAAYGSNNKDLNSFIADPKLVNSLGTTLADYALATGGSPSPCINAGKSTGLVGGSSVDMGFSGLTTRPGCSFDGM